MIMKRISLILGLIAIVVCGNSSNVFGLDKYDIEDAKSGNTNAIYRLGVYHANIAEHEKAYMYFKRAADQGHPQALFRLSEMYDNGYGVAQDRDMGDYYFHIAMMLQQRNNNQGND